MPHHRFTKPISSRDKPEKNKLQVLDDDHHINPIAKTQSSGSILDRNITSMEQDSCFKFSKKNRSNNHAKSEGVEIIRLVVEQEDEEINSSNKQDQEEEAVLRCSSMRRTEIVSREKARSRLIDHTQEEEEQQYSRSTLLATQESITEEDVPDEYRKFKIDAMTLIQCLSLISVAVALFLTFAFQSLRNTTLLKLHLWKWEVVFLVLVCGRLVSGITIRIIVFFVERNFLLRKRVLYFFHGIKTSVQNCLWLGLVLIVWRFLFSKKVEMETQSDVMLLVTKILICFLVTAVLWLIKTLVVKVLASSFHVSTYFDRIQEALFHHYLIKKLSGPPLLELSEVQEETGAKPFRIIPKKKKDNGIITMEDLSKMNQKNVSAWDMKRLIKIVRNDSLTTLDEQTVQNTSEDESTRQIRSEKDAKEAARKIFKNVSQHGTKRHIFQEDLMRFLGEEEAMKMMSLLESALVTKKITKSALKKWLVNAFRERRALSLTLNDTKKAVNKLSHMISFLASIIIIITWLILLEIATTKYLLFLASQVLLLAFMFGNTLKNVFESIVFLFIIHPYDVGDRLSIDSIEMVVEEMNILTTVFLRRNNLKIVYPNILLWKKSIHNYNRSPDMRDSIGCCLHISTPPEKIVAIKQRISSYIDSKPEYWYPKADIIVKSVEDLSIVRLAISPCYKINHQNMVEKATRRGLLVEEVIKILLELDVEHRFNPVDVNVRTIPMVVSSRAPLGWSQNHCSE